MSGIRKETKKSKIVAEKLYVSNFQKPGTLTAQIRQQIETKSFYPSKKVDSDMQANIFSAADCGFGEQEFTSTEERVAWIPVPSTIKLAEVQAKLDAAFANGACIYRVLSNQPILDENQKYGITQGLVTKDHLANSQVVRYPEDHATEPNGLVKDKAGNVQYRRTFFWNSAKEDVDARDGQVYLSAELKAELEGASVMEGQTI